MIGRPKQIVVNSRWLTFLQSNHLPLRAFAQLSVARYFETRNPGIPGIINITTFFAKVNGEDRTVVEGIYRGSLAPLAASGAA